MITKIEPTELNKRIQQGDQLKLVDVRTPLEFASGHVPGAVNLPLDILTPTALTGLAGGPPIVFICKGGTRGGKACEQAEVLGIPALNLSGGTEGWKQSGYPVEGSGKEVISLERQVRISAGALVVIGTTLGWLTSPSWLALPLFVGAGLVFAGVTDTCGMAMILAKMPWNQVRSCCSRC